MTQTKTDNEGCVSRLLNFITAFLFLLALGVIAVIAILLFAPEMLANTPLTSFQVNLGEISDLPTAVSVLVIPTDTPEPTPTPTPLLAPTWTPIVPEPTHTSAPTLTRKPTSTASPIPTFPTKTPTRTPTPTPTNTSTPTPLGPTPTPSPTRSSFPFTKTDASPFYLQNSANTAGCDWMGVAGEVLDLNRNPVPYGSYQVHVWGSGIDERVPVGGAPAYGPSGWEQFLFNTPVIRDYNVQLETPSGTAVSLVYSIQTRASCNENLVQLDFVQNH